MTHEEWRDLLSTMGVKDNRERYVSHIKRLATSKAEPVNSYSDNSKRVTHKKKASTVVLSYNKQ